MSYYEKGMGAKLVAELNKDKLTFVGGSGLLAIQLRDTCLMADAAYESCEEYQVRIRELEAALRNVLKPWDGWIFSDDSPIGKARLLLASTSETKDV